jgi:hypothetical protein
MLPDIHPISRKAKRREPKAEGSDWPDGWPDLSGCKLLILSPYGGFAWTICGCPHCLREQRKANGRCLHHRAKEVASDFSSAETGLRSFKNAAISYVVGTGARPERSALHLVADRNLLGRDGQGCGPSAIYGSVTQLRVTDNPRWESTLHVNAGNMVLTDGSAHQFSQTRLADQMASTDNDPNSSLQPN